LLGLGTVGQGVYELLNQRKKEFTERVSRAIEIKKILVRNPSKTRDMSVLHSLYTRSIDSILEDPDIQIVVELAGGVHPAREWILAALRAGKSVVTANKAVLALEGDEILAESHRLRKPILFEAAVAGGIPLLRTIREGLAADRITALYGIINGTTNYILSEMASKGSDFAVVLKEAQRLGYAESDPSFDIDGLDAAHKLIILMRLCFGLNVHLDDIAVEGIADIDALDIAFARHFGYAIRLLAIAKRDGEGRIEARVEPSLVPKDNILAKVEGPYNAAYIHGEAVGDMMLYGKGAGRYPTAAAVVSDILELASAYASGKETYNPPYGYDTATLSRAVVISADDRRGAYYLRFTVLDRPHVLETISKSLAQEGISMASVYQPPSQTGEAASIAILTHDTVLYKLRKALKKIEDCEFLVQKSKLIPIETLIF
jgi:homoserine dehydrogenase